ncbi:MAG: hypothetical protein GXP27_06165 [Planctomycetes bacterium]|nr:hypothetical protein [Planctomycetota bacterium]
MLRSRDLSISRTLIRRIAVLSNSHAAAILAGTRRSRKIDLPFYQQSWLLEFVLSTTQRPPILRYVDNGTDLLYLDSSVDTIYRANRIFGLRLTDNCVAEYVKFFFENVSDGALRVIDSAGDINELLQTSLPMGMPAWSGEGSRREETPLRTTAAVEGWEVEFVGLWMEQLLVTMNVQVAGDGMITPKHSESLATVGDGKGTPVRRDQV